MADFNASIMEKKHFIIKNPDGTYMHCINIYISFFRF